MSKTPEISVLMSVYNGQLYLREAIVSVLKQSFTDFEFIIVNDGSTDKSLSIISEFDDERIVLIKNEPNKGLIFSLNRGLSVARGKYIARMDADDQCAPNRLAVQHEFMEANPQIGLTGSDYVNFSDTFLRNCFTLKKPGVLKAWLLFSTPLCHPSVMMRSNLLPLDKMAYDEKFRFVEDYELWTRLALLTSFENLGESLLFYRHHEAQVSQVARNEQLRASKEIQRSYLNRLGFRFEEAELELHNFISSGKSVQSIQQLAEILNWLNQLRLQNASTKAFDDSDFDYVLSRIFFDVCGNTNLGWKAFTFWNSSDLKKNYGDNLKMKLRQMAKCLFRKFR